jgi:hypothetical protein
MRYFLFQLLFIFWFPFFSGAQGLLSPELPPVDTSLRNDTLLVPQAILWNEPVWKDPGLLFPEFSSLNLPEFDFNRKLLNMREAYRYSIFNPSGTDDFAFRNSVIPFVHSATIFHRAAYQITDKLTIGGSSFGGNSIFSSPLPSRGANSYDFRGASMFFQYKVSKNIKIETHVNVTNRQY